MLFCLLTVTIGSSVGRAVNRNIRGIEVNGGFKMYIAD